MPWKMTFEKFHGTTFYWKNSLSEHCSQWCQWILMTDAETTVSHKHCWSEFLVHSFGVAVSMYIKSWINKTKTVKSVSEWQNIA